MELDEVLDRYQRAVDEFARGDPEPVKQLFSHTDDVALANPFGASVHGWRAVSEALDYASLRSRDGTVSAFEAVATYAAGDLASVHALEHWRARVGDRAEISAFDLRVTSTFRREEGKRRLVHRHADPISTPDAEGPLRRTSLADR